MKTEIVYWELTGALAVCRRLEYHLKTSYHCALGGSVLHSGSSKKDLDIFIYPRRKSKDEDTDWQKLLEELTHFGVAGLKKFDFYKDAKLVYQGTYENKRIDFFFVD